MWKRGSPTTTWLTSGRPPAAWNLGRRVDPIWPIASASRTSLQWMTPPFRGLETMADYRQRCEGELRFWLECHRDRRSGVPPAPRFVTPTPRRLLGHRKCQGFAQLASRFDSGNRPILTPEHPGLSCRPRVWSLRWPSTPVPLWSAEWTSPGSGTIR